MTKRLKIGGISVQVIAYIDNGEANMEPLEVQPMEIPASMIPEFLAEGWEKAVEMLRQQIEAPTEEPINVKS
jgi:hypothetical protein